MSYSFELIKHPMDIIKAKRFLKIIYVDQIKWPIPSNNPSDLRICKDNQGDYLEDKFSDNSNWFRMFDNNAETEAVVRIIHRRSTGLELEHYKKLPEKFTKPDKTCVEINRFAIKKSTKSSQITLEFMYHLLKHLIESEIDYVVLTAQTPQPANLFKELGMQSIDLLPFKYHENDPNKVEILFIDLNQKEETHALLQKLRMG